MRMPLPAPAREELGRGEVANANLKQNTNPETHEINTNEKGCPPHDCQWKCNFKFKIKSCEYELQKRGQKQMATFGT